MTAIRFQNNNEGHESENFRQTLGERLKSHLKEMDLRQINAVSEIENWYSDKNVDKEKNRLYYKIADNLANELINQVMPSYVDDLIGKIETKTREKETTLQDIEIGLLDFNLHPFVEFGKLLNGIKVIAIKFIFHVNIVTHIDKVIIKKDQENTIFKLDNLKIDFRLFLVGIEIIRSDVGNTPLNPLQKKIKLKEVSIKLFDMVLNSKDRSIFNSMDKQETERLNIKRCQNCSHKNMGNSIFCNMCGSKLD